MIIRKAALLTGTFVAVLFCSQALATDEAIIVEMKWRNSTLRLPLVTQSLFNFESASGTITFRDGSSYRPAQIRIKAKTEELIRKGFSLRDVTFPLGPACKDGFITSPICAFTKNSYLEPYTIYDIDVRPMSDRVKQLIKRSGGVLTSPEEIQKSMAIRKLEFDGDVLRFFNKLSNIGNYSFILDGDLYCTIRIFFHEILVE